VEASTATTAPEAPPEPADGEGSTSQPQEVDHQQSPENGDERDEQGRYLSREAASYRRRLRDAEAERDQLRAQLDHLQTAEVERLAGDAGLQVPGDVWQFGAQLEHLRDETGSIHPEAVRDLVGEIVKDRPGLQARPVGDLGIGRGSAAAGTVQTPEVGLSALLKPERR
jgi:hypothetical protein